MYKSRVSRHFVLNCYHNGRRNVSIMRMAVNTDYNPVILNEVKNLCTITIVKSLL